MFLLAPHPHPPLASANHTSYLLTGIAIAASILGRMSAQELRYDSARLFRNQESSRALSLELRRRRQEYKDQEGVRLAAEQKRRVVEVTEKARQEGATYEKVYKTQLQFLFSRVQEHQHLYTSKGVFPLKGCLNKRCKTKCLLPT